MDDEEEDLAGQPEDGDSAAGEAGAEEPPEEDGELPYFILHGKDAEGPYTPEQVCAELVAGRLTPGSYCWNQTMPEWQTLRAVFPFAMAAHDPVSDDGRTPPLAGFGRRFLAGCIDLGVIVAVYALLMILLPPFRLWVETASVDPMELAKVNALLVSLTYLYFLLTLGPVGGGATLGYRRCGIRLVDQHGRGVPSWTQALLWCLGSLSLPVGWPFYWFDRQRRMLHNGISQTLVFRYDASFHDTYPIRSIFPARISARQLGARLGSRVGELLDVLRKR